MAFSLGECLLLRQLEKKKWNQAEFARRMGVTRQYISKIVSGEDKMSLEFAINASFLLECKVTDFYILEPRRRKE